MPDALAGLSLLHWYRLERLLDRNDLKVHCRGIGDERPYAVQPMVSRLDGAVPAGLKVFEERTHGLSPEVRERYFGNLHAPLPGDKGDELVKFCPIGSDSVAAVVPPLREIFQEEAANQLEEPHVPAFHDPTSGTMALSFAQSTFADLLMFSGSRWT